MSKFNIGVVFFILVSVVFYINKNRNHNSISKTKGHSQILEEWDGWIELASSDYKPLMKGKILKQHDSSMWFGYGYLVQENINNNFLKDLMELEYISSDDGKVLVKFGIDALSSNIISELKESSIERSTLVKVLENNSEPSTVKVWMTSTELGLPQKPDQISQFEKMWKESR